MPRNKVELRLGVRGRITSGPRSGMAVLIESVGPTPVDRLPVVTSPDLDIPGHPEERVDWIWPEDISRVLSDWSVEWSAVEDDQLIARFL